MLALSISPVALDTPSASISSFVSLIPAVSSRVTGNPPNVTSWVTMSLVVPGSELVMLLFIPTNAFISVDFPALGLPTITTLKPLEYAVPAAKEPKRLLHSKILFSINLTVYESAYIH